MSKNKPNRSAKLAETDNKATEQKDMNEIEMNDIVTNPNEIEDEVEPEATNLFVFENEPNEIKAESRKLDYTPMLIDRSNRRAQELMLTQHSVRPELNSLVQKVLKDLDPSDLKDLLEAFFGDTIEDDSVILDGCDAGQLSRLLESRRSDRSKAKAKNPAKSMVVCKTYFSSMYAELLIRIKTGVAYTGSNSSQSINIEELKDDPDAIARKVKSLQSKKCRLNKLAQYDPAAKVELDEVNAEIDRLNSYRPNTKTVSKNLLKDVDVDKLRSMIKDIDQTTLTDEQQAKLEDLIKKLM